MQIALIIIAGISFMCFGTWLRTHGTDSSPFYRSIAYIAGPVHFALTVPFYILFTIEYGFFTNSFSLIFYAIIAGHYFFVYWFFTKYYSQYNKKILDLIFEIPNQTSLIIITVFPNAFAIIMIGGMQFMDSSIFR